MAGLFGSAGLCDYSTSKFAAIGFDESLRNELLRLGKHGVKTTVVCPYFVNTEMAIGIFQFAFYFQIWSFIAVSHFNTRNQSWNYSIFRTRICCK